MPAGYLYVLSNPAMPGIVKVGKTTICPTVRSRKLFTTGVPEPFEIEASAYFADVDEAEVIFHERMAAFRISDRREFFECDVPSSRRELCRLMLCEQNEEPLDCSLAEACCWLQYILGQMFGECSTGELYEAMHAATPDDLRGMMERGRKVVADRAAMMTAGVPCRTA